MRFGPGGVVDALPSRAPQLGITDRPLWSGQLQPLEHPSMLQIVLRQLTHRWRRSFGGVSSAIHVPCWTVQPTPPRSGGACGTS